MELIPSLPHDIALDCLLRAPLYSHAVLRQVCRAWKSLLSAPSFLQSRRAAGYTRHQACFIQALPTTAASAPHKTPVYGISLYDPARRSWERPPPLPDFPAGLPLFCQCVSVGSRLIVLGGWDPATWAALTSVYVYDFGAGRWRRGADMPRVRSFFACGSLPGGRVAVAGGHDDNKNALRTAEVYDVALDAWAALPDMQQERDECKGVVVAGGEFVVVSGFPTDAQGQFGTSAERWDAGAGGWRLVEGVWAAEGKSPSSIVWWRGQLYALLDGKLVRRKGGPIGGDEASPSSWEVVDALPDGVKAGSACTVALGDDSILVLCGCGSGGLETFLFAPSSSAPLCKRLPPQDGFLGLSQASCTLQL